jgi:DNA sulfur modification protein DndB
MSFEFPAMKGHQGGRTFYLVTVPFTYLKRFLAIDTGDVLDRSQRLIDAPRVESISNYLNSNREDFVLPALTGVVEDTDLEFIEFGEPGSGVGRLKLTLSAVVKLFDGQHRASGIMNAVRRSLFFKADQIAIQLFTGMDLKQRQQAFSDINNNAKPVNKSLNMAYSHRDDVIRPLVVAIQKVEAWKDRIDFERDTVAKSSPYLFSLKNIIQACRIAMAIKKKDVLGNWSHMELNNYWGVISTDIGWAEYTEERTLVQIPKLSDTAANKVSFTVAGLMTLARINQQIISRPITSKAKSYVRGEALRSIDWGKDAAIWRGNIVKENGNMDASITAQNAAAAAIMAVYDSVAAKYTFKKS